MTTIGAMRATTPTDPGTDSGPDGVRIVHLDDHCIVAVKPAGLLSVPGRGAEKRDCLAGRIQALHADALVVHRRVLATSGLVVFARGLEAQRRRGAAFEQRAVVKTYVAVVAGLLAADSGAIDLPLRADWPNRPKQVVDAARGKAALTHYRVQARDPSAQTTRVELRPVTGRSHQLRVHLQALGHPILGDALYAPPSVQGGAERLLLHAAALCFPHPAHGASIAIDSPVPF
jgi:tRNA pseudouridine32 synthase/23S rRNA pseudouridine746 synthase